MNVRRHLSPLMALSGALLLVGGGCGKRRVGELVLPQGAAGTRTAGGAGSSGQAGATPGASGSSGAEGSGGLGGIGGGAGGAAGSAGAPDSAAAGAAGLAGSSARTGQGGAAGTGQGGAAGETVTRHKPDALVRWEPAATAKISAIAHTSAGEHTFVGFTDGSLFSGPGMDVRPRWSEPRDEPPLPGAPHLPDLPITSIHILPRSSPPIVWVAFGGTGNGPRIWVSGGREFGSRERSSETPVWSVSHNLLTSNEVIALAADGTYVSKDYGVTWSTSARPVDRGLSFGEEEWITCIRSMEVGSSTEHWVGTNLGRVFRTENADFSTPGWSLRHDPRMPSRPVVGITLNPARPDDVWITYAGIYADGVWHSEDQGLTWRVRHTSRLPTWPVPPSLGSLTAVTWVPRWPAFYVGVVTLEGAEPPSVATSFWMMTDEQWVEN